MPRLAELVAVQGAFLFFYFYFLEGVLKEMLGRDACSLGLVRAHRESRLKTWSFLFIIIRISYIVVFSKYLSFFPFLPEREPAPRSGC